jgi:hypothetical protein
MNFILFTSLDIFTEMLFRIHTKYLKTGGAVAKSKGQNRLYGNSYPLLFLGCHQLVVQIHHHQMLRLEETLEA